MISIRISSVLIVLLAFVTWSFAESPTPVTSAARKDPIEINDPDFSASFDALYQKTWGPGVVPEKYKQLTGVSISIVERCETCLGWHIKEAVRLRANKNELIEAIRVGLLTGGSITIPTVRKAYEILEEQKVR